LGEVSFYHELGRTGLVVSRLCFGALTVGPLQRNLTVAEGAVVIERALELGVNFIDTAELYGTYPYIREATRRGRHQPIVATKPYAFSREDMARSVERARRELNRDVIDIFLLHEQESELTIRGHREAFDYLQEQKAKGSIRAVGISTHAVAGVRAAANIPELDVIHPLINIKGMGIIDGSVGDMLGAIEAAVRAGKGLYPLKPFGGGNIIANVREALEFVLNIPGLASVAIGMKSAAEVEMNAALISGLPVPAEVEQAVNCQDHHLHIEGWCEGCGTCVPNCRYQALALEGKKVRVDRSRCILCGYCGAACPNFCIKVI